MLAHLPSHYSSAAGLCNVLCAAFTRIMSHIVFFECSLSSIFGPRVVVFAYFFKKDRMPTAAVAHLIAVRKGLADAAPQRDVQLSKADAAFIRPCRYWQAVFPSTAAGSSRVDVPKPKPGGPSAECFHQLLASQGEQGRCSSLLSLRTLHASLAVTNALPQVAGLRKI